MDPGLQAWTSQQLQVPKYRSLSNRVGSPSLNHKRTSLLRSHCPCALGFSDSDRVLCALGPRWTDHPGTEVLLRLLLQGHPPQDALQPLLVAAQTRESSTPFSPAFPKDACLPEGPRPGQGLRGHICCTHISQAWTAWPGKCLGKQQKPPCWALPC